jgi:hypothetical protein
MAVQVVAGVMAGTLAIYPVALDKKSRIHAVSV